MGKKRVPPPGGGESATTTAKVPYDVVKFAREMDVRAVSGELETGPVTQPPITQPVSSKERALTRPQARAARGAEGCPSVVASTAQLKDHGLDAKAGFLLSLMDGKTDLETLVALSGMPRADVLRRVRELVDLGVVEMR